MTHENGHEYEAYVFDLDGALLNFSDDLSCYLETIKGIFAEMGVEADDSDFRTLGFTVMPDDIDGSRSPG